MKTPTDTDLLDYLEKNAGSLFQDKSTTTWPDGTVCRPWHYLCGNWHISGKTAREAILRHIEVTKKYA